MEDKSRYTWPYFLEDVVSRFGDKEAIRFGELTMSYTELMDQARTLAKSLAISGVVKGARVAVHMANRPEFIVASFATAMVGAVFVPINTFSTLDEREYILRHSDASVLLFSATLLKYDFLSDLKSLIPEIKRALPGKILSEKLPCLRRVVCLGLEEPEAAIESWSNFMTLGAAFPDAVLDAIIREVFPSDDGMIIYTSGSTAKPKAVLHMQRAPVIISWRFSEDLRYTPEDRIWTTYPFFWSAGIAYAIGACLGSGAVLIFEETFDPEIALNCFVRNAVTGIQAWPHQEKALAEHPLAKKLQLPIMTKLDSVSPFAPLVGITEDKWGIFGSYGMTETFTLVSNIPADSPAQLRKDTAGRALPGTQIRIVDETTGAELPVAVHGEIAVKSQTFMRGYYKVDPENYLDNDGFFHTQDGGYIDEHGYLHWSGRLSGIIKTGGANVSPLEIEESLKCFPNLRASIPFGAPHPTLGEVIVLCAVTLQGKSVEIDEINTYLKQKLAAYKRPKHILLFNEDDLEFTGTQKIKSSSLISKAMRRLQHDNIEIEGVDYGSFLSG